MRAIALALLLIPLGANALSLFPLRNPVERLLPALPAARPGGLSVEQWLPYGLEGVTVSGLELRGGWRDLSLGLLAGSQAWGPLRAESLELDLTLRGPLRFGAALRLERMAGSRPHAALSLLLGGGGAFAWGLRGGLWAGENWDQDRGGGLCALALGPLTLQLLFPAAMGEAGAEGLGLRWRMADLEVGLLAAGGGDAASWQELSLAWERARWGLAFKTRMHPSLGASRGVAFRVR